MKRFITISLILIISNTGFSKTRIPDPNSPGGKILLSQCKICHATPHPKRFKFQQWMHTLDMMEQFMQKKQLRFTQEDREILNEYFQKHSRP